MFKKYSPKPIHSYKSYKISDLCRIYKAQDLHPQTIRKWINQQGLKAFLHERDFYIYGAVFKEFLANRNQQHKEKNQLEFNQFRCGKCKSKQPPLDNIINKLTTGFNGSIKAFGVCGKCNHQIKRNYKRSELAEIKEIFQIKLDEVSALCNSLNSTNKTNINDGQKVGGSEPLENNHPYDVKNISPPIGEIKQLTLFDFLN